jgi:hypothetical protein
MDLILHIGTHKTASTSLQHFFTLNRDVLRSNGVHYPSNPNSAYVTNYLASELAFGRGHPVRNFLCKAKSDAQALGCSRVLISAESFYAMTAFFLDLYDRRTTEVGYWDNEKRLVSELKSYCSAYDNVRVVCYVRPQDEFAGSIYNQMVKSTVGTSLSYLGFVEKLKPAFDYERHLRLWKNAFGEDCVRIARFDEADGNILRHFCAQFLTPACYELARRDDFLANTRLSRNVLEVKRAFNAVEPDRAYAFVAAKVFRDLSDNYPDGKGYQVFADTQVQQEFFSAFEDGNRALSTSSGFSAPLSVVTHGESGYPGLSTGLGLEITMRFFYEMASPRRKIEVVLRRLARFVKERIPGGRWIVLPAQMVLHRIRLRHKGW